MTRDDFRERYERANQWGDPAFIERPYIGSPGAPAQDETNASNTWTHLNGGFLVANEYTRWWKESRALRNAAILGDWSWLNKVRVTGSDVDAFLQYATVVDIADQAVGHARFTPMVNDDGHIAIEGITFKLAEGEYLFTQSGALQWLQHLRSVTDFDVELDDVLDAFGEQFESGAVAPPMELPSGQFRISYLPVEQDGERVGWASGSTYSPTFREMISNARIDATLANEGETVTVRWGGFAPGDPEREIAATVHPDALYESKERRSPRG